MIFVDTNIFMYAAGRNHPFKAACGHFLKSLTTGQQDATTNVEVLQEILYRYDCINDIKSGFVLFDQIMESFLRILSVTPEDLKIAKDLQKKLGVKTRDAIHAATMKSEGLKTIMSYERDFDKINWIKRITPSELV